MPSNINKKNNIKKSKRKTFTTKKIAIIFLIIGLAGFATWRLLFAGAAPNNCQPEKNVPICDVDQVQGNLDNILSNGPEAYNLGQDKANWPLYLGTAFRAPTATLDGAQPVYRMFNPAATFHDYLFDAPAKEKQAKDSKVVNEGVAFFAWPTASRSGLVPVYKLTQLGSTTKVIFTTDKAWRDLKIAEDANNKDGWKDSGIAFYAFPPNYKAIGVDNKPQENPYDCSIKENFVSERCTQARTNLDEAVKGGRVANSDDCPATVEAYRKEAFPSRFSQECRDKWNGVISGNQNTSTQTQNQNTSNQPTGNTPTPPTTNPNTPPVPKPADAKISCDGNGTSGYRTQFVYLYFEGEPDRLEQKRTEIEAMAVRIDQMFQNSAKKTGGVRKVRYVHSNTQNNCKLDIKKITLSRADQAKISRSGSESLRDLMSTLQDKKFGFTDIKRKYVVYSDHDMKAYSGLCGLGGLVVPTSDKDAEALIKRLRSKGAVINTSQDFKNLRYTKNAELNIYENLPGLALFPTGNVFGDRRIACNTPILAIGENEPSDVQAHELIHTFGAVSDITPNGSKRGHCIDEYDVMCYKDEARELNFGACSNKINNWLLDCNNDDYFSTNPKPNSFLSKRWNIANSKYLIKQ